MINKKFTVEKEMRLDMFLSEKLDETRNQINHLISKGFVSIENKKKAKSGMKLQVGQVILVNLPEIAKERLKEEFDGISFDSKSMDKVDKIFHFLVVNVKQYVNVKRIIDNS